MFCLYERARLGVLVGILVWFFGVIGLFVVNLVADTYATKYFIEHPGSNLVYLGFLLALSLPTGLVTYFYAKKQYTEKYIPCKNSLQKLRKAVTERRAEEMNIIEKTLQLVGQTSVWLPSLIEYKNEEALTYGLVAFLLTALVSANSSVGMPIAVLVGVIVWIYSDMRNEKRLTSRLKNLRPGGRNLKREKATFLEAYRKVGSRDCLSLICMLSHVFLMFYGGTTLD